MMHLLIFEKWLKAGLEPWPSMDGIVFTSMTRTMGSTLGKEERMVGRKDEGEKNKVLAL